MHPAIVEYALTTRLRAATIFYLGPNTLPARDGRFVQDPSTCSPYRNDILLLVIPPL